MTVLDAYALTALLTDEPAADEVDPLVRAGAAVSVVNLAEVSDVAQRVHGAHSVEVRTAVELLIATGLEVRTVAEGDAWRAAELRHRYYDRRSRALSLADCFLLAAAREGEAIATADPAVAEAARAEGIGVAALPDRRGRRP